MMGINQSPPFLKSTRLPSLACLVSVAAWVPFLFSVNIISTSLDGYKSEQQHDDAPLYKQKPAVDETLPPTLLTFPPSVDKKVAQHLSYAWTLVNEKENPASDNKAPNKNPNHSSPIELKSISPELDGDDNLNRIRNRTCVPTSQFQLVIPRDRSQPWRLQTLDDTGALKTVGGDEFYIKYRHGNATTTRGMKTTKPSAVAYSQDLQNGQYELNFWTTPLSPNVPTNLDMGGTLTLYLDYTCDLGCLGHPFKQCWRTGGAIMTEYEIEVPRAPPMTHFVPPSHSVNLAMYHKVVMFGDSNIHGLYASNHRFFPNLKFIRKPDSPVHPISMPRLFLPKISWFLNLTIQEEEAKIKDKQANFTATNSTLRVAATAQDNSERKYALMIGSHCWDIVFPERGGHNFERHLQAVEEMLTALRKDFSDDLVDIYWHSGFALQLHVANGKGWEQRDPLKYMSWNRSLDLWQRQEQVLKRVGGITRLDFLHATYLSADYYRTDDARHVQSILDIVMLGWYYNPKYGG